MTTTAETGMTARLARLQRLGAYSDRDQQNEAYKRGHAVARMMAERDRRREQRRLDLVNRERDAIGARRKALWMLRESLYGARMATIRDRVIAERKARGPARAVARLCRDPVALSEALYDAPDYAAIHERKRAAEILMDRIRKTRREERLSAGVLALDTTAERREKVRRYRAGTAIPRGMPAEV